MTEGKTARDVLLPCPFCGHDRIFPLSLEGGPDVPYAECAKCGALGPESGVLDWNRRATPTPPAPAVRDDGARVLLERLAEPYRWTIDNGHDAEKCDFLLRNNGDWAGHLQIQMDACKQAYEYLAAADAVAGAGRDGDALDVEWSESGHGQPKILALLDESFTLKQSKIVMATHGWEMTWSADEMEANDDSFADQLAKLTPSHDLEAKGFTLCGAYDTEDGDIVRLYARRAAIAADLAPPAGEVGSG